MSFLTPKALLTYLVLLPQFVSHTAVFPVVVQLTLLGLVHIANCAEIYVLVGYFTRKILNASPRTTRFIGWFSGGSMVLISLALIAEQIHAWV